MTAILTIVVVLISLAIFIEGMRSEGVQWKHIILSLVTFAGAVVLLLSSQGSRESTAYYRGYEAALADTQQEKDEEESISFSEWTERKKTESANPSVYASDFLYNKAREQAEKIDAAYGADAYGGTSSLYGNERPATTSAGTPINYDFDMATVDMIDTPDSSCFSEIGYDERAEVLVVVFRDSGSTYAYYDVPEAVWEDLIFASSIGGYYNSEIKGQYECEKIE